MFNNVLTVVLFIILEHWEKAGKADMTVCTDDDIDHRDRLERWGGGGNTVLRVQ